MNFRSGKLQFDKSKPYIKTDEDGQELFRRLALPKTTKLKIELLEISGIDNPSDIVLEIAVIDINTQKRTIPLFKYRGKFLFQNNLFILDTSDLPQFEIPLESLLFSINVKSDNDFKLTLYYSTDQKPYQDEIDTL